MVGNEATVDDFGFIVPFKGAKWIEMNRNDRNESKWCECLPWSHLGHILAGGKVSPTYGDDTSSLHRYLRLAGMLFLGTGPGSWIFKSSPPTRSRLSSLLASEKRFILAHPGSYQVISSRQNHQSSRPGSCMAEPLRHAVPRKLQLSHPTDISSSGEAKDFFNILSRFMWYLSYQLQYIIRYFK